MMPNPTAQHKNTATNTWAFRAEEESMPITTQSSAAQAKAIRPKLPTLLADALTTNGSAGGSNDIRSMS